MHYSPSVNAAWLEFLNSIATVAALVWAATIIENDAVLVAGVAAVADTSGGVTVVAADYSLIASAVLASHYYFAAWHEVLSALLSGAAVLEILCSLHLSSLSCYPWNSCEMLS